MSITRLKVENISKQYRLGEVGTGTLSHDLKRYWYKIRGKEDPYSLVTEVNNRTIKGSSDYVWAIDNINFEVKQNQDSSQYLIEINQYVHGNLQTSKLDEEFLMSGEYRQIIKSSNLTRNLIGPGAIISRGEKSRSVNNFHDVLDWLMAEAKNTLNIQRYKGLGEMNPGQLWETTMDPSMRRLLKVTIEDTIALEETFTDLMGDNVEPRRNFIEKNALGASNLDI